MTGSGPQLAFPDLAGTIAALALGTCGGAIFFGLGLPLPWMLGALFVTMAAAIAGLPIKGPQRLRPAVVAVIGVLLGARFLPEVMGQVTGMLVTLAILMVYLAAVAALVVPFYRLVGRLDWTTAYFAGMPGGLSEMVELGAARGAHVPTIVLAHSLRIVMTIGLMGFVFRVILDHDLRPAVPAGAGQGAGQGLVQGLGPQDAALLAGCALLGAFLGGRLRLPAPSFLGPLILSAAVHLTGWTESTPPSGLVIAAQIALGTILGCRFRGLAPNRLARAALLSAGAAVLSLVLALAAGLAMGRATGVGLDQALLALAPGGLTEMGLIALSIQADVAFVAVHHVARILIVIVVAPMLGRFDNRQP